MMKTATFRVIATLLLFIFIFVISPSAVFANGSYQPSTWALQKIEISERSGIIPEGFYTRPFTDSINRMDFAELMISTCRFYGITIPELPAVHPFKDTTDNSAESAYMLGLLSGTSPGVFNPDLPLTREMAAVVLSRMRMLFQSFSDIGGINAEMTNLQLDLEGTIEYEEPMNVEQAVELLGTYSSDSTQVSEWAKTHMADVYSLGLLNGIGGGKTHPKGNITREQAAVLAFNLLTFCDVSQIKTAGVTECVLPVPTGIYIAQTYRPGDLYLCWNAIPTASAYDVTLMKDGDPVYTVRTSNTFIDLRTNIPEYRRVSYATADIENEFSLFSTIFGSAKTPIHATIRVAAVDSDEKTSIFCLDKEFTIVPYISKNELITGDREKQQFASRSEAEENMTKITIKVWNLTDSGSKVTSNRTLTVNKNVAEDVIKIFDEIYNGAEKFPIKDVSGYAFRDGNSQHSNGTAIDINPNENYFVTWKGKILAGSLWEPGENPYSILPDGDVVRAFNMYEWHWSPDMKWPNGADYMHFSLIGT